MKNAAERDSGAHCNKALWVGGKRTSKYLTVYSQNFLSLSMKKQKGRMFKEKLIRLLCILIIAKYPGAPVKSFMYM